MVRPRVAKKILVASLGVASVNYAVLGAGCSSSQVIGNFMSYDCDSGPNACYAPYDAPPSLGDVNLDAARKDATWPDASVPDGTPVEASDAAAADAEDADDGSEDAFDDG